MSLIDVSSWQKEVNYEKVKQELLVMIRLGYQGSVTKNLAIDIIMKII